AEAFSNIANSHRVIAEVPPETTVLADPTALYQVLGLLLDNAVKYSPGGGTVTVRATRVAEDLEIAVIDEGMGLPEGIDVFAPFERGDAGVARRTPGVGLGLHIARNLLDAMGGSISAQRNAGRGSTFNIRIP